MSHMSQCYVIYCKREILIKHTACGAIPQAVIFMERRASTAIFSFICGLPRASVANRIIRQQNYKRRIMLCTVLSQ
nr:MAG TPA: hypothetical protein [Caudoviricetes sp.]